MRKIIKSLILIMAIATLAVVIMPNNVSATVVVNEIRISTSQVKHGSTISKNVTSVSTVPAGAVNSLTIGWLVSSNSTGTPWSEASGTFEGGNYYAWEFDILDMNSGYVFMDGITKYYINDVEYTPGTFAKVEKVSANVAIYDFATANRGKIAIANDVNSNKPESTSTLSVDLAKDSTATLYVTPDLDYAVEKILVDGVEVPFVWDSSASGTNKPYKSTIVMDGSKDILVYFRERKTLKYSLSVDKKSTDVERVTETTNKTDLINQKKNEFIDAINTFKTGKENVTDLTDETVSSLFSGNKYAVITDITYENSVYEPSSNLVAIGDLHDWDDLQVAQGYITRTANYKIEYTEVALENYTYEENPNTGDGIVLSMVIGGISFVGLVGCGLFLRKKEEI